MKARIENKEKNIEIVIRDNEITIEGLELKPYWKRIMLFICPWVHPKFIIRNPRILYNRESKGELLALYG